MDNLRSCLNHSLKLEVFFSLMTSFSLKLLLNSYVLAISFSLLTLCQCSYYHSVPETCISFDRTKNSIRNDCFKQTFETSNKNHTELFCRIHTMNPPDVKQCYEPIPRISFFFYETSSFERYLKTYKTYIEQLFHRNRTENLVIIILTNVDLTAINWKQINQSLYSIFPSIQKFWLHLQDTSFTGDHFAFLGHNLQGHDGLRISVSCQELNKTSRIFKFMDYTRVGLHYPDCTSSFEFYLEEVNKVQIHFRFSSIT